MDKTTSIEMMLYEIMDAAEGSMVAHEDDIAGTPAEPFCIDDDQKAEWALRLIREERAEVQRLKDVCKAQIEAYEQSIRQYDERLERRTGRLKDMLAQYFSKVPHKATKTRESYELPSGKLVLKRPAPKITVDHDALGRWLNDQGMGQYIREVKLVPDWPLLKKEAVGFTGSGRCYLKETGETIESVYQTAREPEFEVEVSV